jgi:hypothetical protein
MHAYLRVVCVGGQRGQSRIAGLGSYSTIIQGGRRREEREHINNEYRVGLDDDETTLNILLYVPVGHDHVIEWSYTAEDMMIDHDVRSYITLNRIASHDIASHRMISHRIALHCIASHRIASHRIASHRIASHRIASHDIASHRIA